MKETPLSLCERSFILTNLSTQLRLDARHFSEIRDIEINFGNNYGCCMVSLGETRVLAQVTCEIVEPRPSRPHEGKVSIVVHLSSMAASHFEPGRGNELVDDIQQILDRNIKESKCLDLESLCIMAEESVWQLKIDITILNHAGNLGDACNLAAVAALRHFHRPDITVQEDGRVTIHTEEERKFIPTFLKKIPVCLTYGLFVVEGECIVIIDPTEKEERVMSGKICVGLNPHGEITSLIFPGKVCLQKSQILNIVKKAFVQAKTIAELVTKVVDEDLEKRKLNKSKGFSIDLKSDEEYAKNLLLERVKGTRRLELNNDALHNQSMECAPLEYKEENMEESDEEFSEEFLRKNLTEIRREKAKKLEDQKTSHSDDVQLEDQEIESGVVKFKLDIT